MVKCYVMARINTETLTVESVDAYSEGPDTITAFRPHTYAVIFETEGADFREAVGEAKRLIYEVISYEWMRQFIDPGGG